MKKDSGLDCDICGEKLERQGLLSQTTCKKCGLERICGYCANIHDCKQTVVFREMDKRGAYDHVVG